MSKQEGILIVISGFSGAGKGTLMKRLLSDYDEFALSISMTSRGMREGEANGREYFFVSREEFEAAIKAGKLLEHAEYCGNYYGTPKEYVETKLKEGKNVILEIEVQGAMQIRKKFPKALLLYVTPPSIAELEKRLKKRGTETDEVIKRRLTQAKTEVDFVDDYDYLVINDDLDECVKEMYGIICASAFEIKRQDAFIDELHTELDKLNF
ncbi:MAG: guanylate kinase [Lachnospiraceae bacterium]|nr:guanylate kinase [Lachnospiraceae bacterium]